MANDGLTTSQPRVVGATVDPSDHALDSSRIARIYAQRVLRAVPRVLGMMDREPHSPTCGCLDRTYWAWKFIDFPGARFQEGLCALAFVFRTPIEGNVYHEEPRLLQWIEQGLRFWRHIQRRGGDFDEAYPFERSLAATAFSSFYCAEASRMLEGQLSPGAQECVRETLAKAGDWLCRNDETHGFLSNHLAAAAAALYHAYQVCGEERFERRSRYFLDRILEHQSAEGWYDEYGGADPGYQTHGSFYLARLWQLCSDPRLCDSLERSFKFLAHFIHPDGSLGGEYASRNTQTYYPAAFEMLSPHSGSARWIAETQEAAVESNAAAGLESVDPYNLFPLMNNYVFAWKACLAPNHRAAYADPPDDSPGQTHFARAGLLKVRRPRYVAYVGLSKGGVVKVFDRDTGRLAVSDCGYLGRMKSGKWLASQWYVPDRAVEVIESRVSVQGRFYQIKKLVMKPTMFAAFRAFTLTVGRMRALAYWVKKLLVKALIYRKRELDLHFERRIEFMEDALVIEDRLNGSIGERIERLDRMASFTTIHMGSSKYFVPYELVESAHADDTQVDLNRLANGMTLTRRIGFMGDTSSE